MSYLRGSKKQKYYAFKWLCYREKWLCYRETREYTLALSFTDAQILVLKRVLRCEYLAREYIKSCMCKQVNVPLSAPAATMYLAQPHPTSWNATEKGALGSIFPYGTIKQRVTASKQYKVVVTTMDPISPIGISLAGFLVSSAMVDTASKPTYAKNNTADAWKIPRGPYGSKSL